MILMMAISMPLFEERTAQRYGATYKESQKHVTEWADAFIRSYNEDEDLGHEINGIKTKLQRREHLESSGVDVSRIPELQTPDLNFYTLNGMETRHTRLHAFLHLWLDPYGAIRMSPGQMLKYVGSGGGGVEYLNIPVKDGELAAYRFLRDVMDLVKKRELRCYNYLYDRPGVTYPAEFEWLSDDEDDAAYAAIQNRKQAAQKRKEAAAAQQKAKATQNNPKATQNKSKVISKTTSKSSSGEKTRANAKVSTKDQSKHDQPILGGRNGSARVKDEPAGPKAQDPADKKCKEDDSCTCGAPRCPGWNAFKFSWSEDEAVESKTTPKLEDDKTQGSNHMKGATKTGADVAVDSIEHEGKCHLPERSNSCSSTEPESGESSKAQTTTPATTPGKATPEAEDKCASCDVTLKKETMIHGRCEHRYCVDCAATILEGTLVDTSTFPPRCCREPLVFENKEDLFNPRLFGRYELAMIKHKDPKPLYCHVQTCGAYIIPEAYGKCHLCGARTCKKCLREEHYRACLPLTQQPTITS
ncbi:uncharacterized protein N7506_012047 [Penicillium brevicompactum]|uniref:uncharacterized protein n=1 Tax=Penicillium brevicompactum TaxID=5074 RepID=UPI00253FEA8C|nr:uncharacterized protein N7506_012047 [Penicillium brevicompactum]KAJ5319343.1 hypothetical protein N7506_012047 [Penicillium brevicompactum]